MTPEHRSGSNSDDIPGTEVIVTEAASDKQSQRFFFPIVKAIAKSRNELTGGINKLLNCRVQTIDLTGVHLRLKTDRVTRTTERFEEFGFANDY